MPLFSFDPIQDILRDEELESYHTSSSTEKDPRNFNISESLLIGFNYSGGDTACLTVVKRKKDKLEVVNTFYGNAAKYMYQTLLGLPPNTIK